MTIKNHSKICLIVSCAIMVIALIMTLTGHGINQGIDFAGGMSMQYNMGKEVTQADVEAVLKEMGVEGTVTVQGANKDEVNIRIKDINTEDVQTVQSTFVEKISATYPDVKASGEVNYVGPVAGRTLVSNAIWSVVIASALMLVYIAIRFDLASGLASVLMLVYIAIRFDLNSGLAAVFGLLHDVLMMLSFMVIFRSVIQMNSSFIAAALTIVGYSINNTIVIFDRIRENAKKMPTTAKEEVANISVRESLGRTICTTLTTLITIVALCILGVASIREFALPIIVGILSGVYSANMINPYIWAFLEEKRRARKAKA